MILEGKSRKRSAIPIFLRTREIPGVIATFDLIVQEKGILIGMMTTEATGMKRHQIVMNRAGDMADITEIAAGSAVGAHNDGVGKGERLRDTAPRNRVAGAGAGNEGRLKAGIETIVPTNRVVNIAAEATARVNENKPPKELYRKRDLFLGTKKGSVLGPFRGGSVTPDATLRLHVVLRPFTHCEEDGDISAIYRLHRNG